MDKGHNSIIHYNILQADVCSQENTDIENKL